MSTSSGGFFSESNKKGEVSELQKNLQSPEVQRDARQYRKVVRKVIAYMTLGMDVSPLFMDMIKVKTIILFLFRCKNIGSNMCLNPHNYHFQHFSVRLRSFSGWGQSQVMEMLLRYQPQDTEEVFDILNLLDDRLKQPNSAVVMACIQLFIHLTRGMKDIAEDVYKRIKGPLMTILSSSNSELVYVCLCHIELLLSKMPKLFDREYRSFFSRHTDPLFIKSKKLTILTTIASDTNCEEIVTELSAHVHDVDVKMSKEAVKAIGEIAMHLPHSSEYCIDALLSFLSWEIEYISSQTLVVIRDLLLKYEKSAIAVLPQIGECLEIVQDPKGIAAIIWIIGEYGQSIVDSPYLLEPLIDRIASEQSADVKLQLLTATVKLFFKKPPECQHMLGRLLKFCVDEEMHMDVHDRALFYYRLLKTGPKEVLLGDVIILIYLPSRD
ncbi:PREDICTED: beta-adaptin-like protein A [Acropora digitifera]|uniref:beta-adaptin-like protein A n=1 Tax=Acropora digitifera TaxID=70779 RepID=UPI00077A5CF6|nr:PREDICTED: beta-adaptin-like protein A [Acropora digitifera]